VALENGYIWTAAAIALSYNSTYDRLLDEPHTEPPSLQKNALSNTQLQLSAELRQKLGDNPPAETEDADHSGAVGVFGLAKTVTEERHMFTNHSTAAVPVTQPVTSTAPPKPKTALSKLVEFPGDPARLAELLCDESVSLNGRDMYGITALMKFAAWNKVELLRMILSRLTAEEVNTTGGKQRLPLLHYCVDMDAYEALRVLLEDDRVDKNMKDEHGRHIWESLYRSACESTHLS
jgi:hypothetical protein